MKNGGNNIRLGVVLMWAALMIGISHAAHVTYRDHGSILFGWAKPSVAAKN